MIHPQAIIETDAIGSSTNIWAFTHVMAGASIGDHGNVGDHSFVETGAKIGNRVTVKNNVCVWDGVTIEDEVFIGPRVTFTNDRFPRSARMSSVSEHYRDKANWLEQTVVKRGCSIGAAATICPGVTLGEFSMIAAGSVVTKDVPPFALVVGNPAKQIAFVCTCGQKLDGEVGEAVCSRCGEEGIARINQIQK